MSFLCIQRVVRTSKSKSESKSQCFGITSKKGSHPESPFGKYVRGTMFRSYF